VPRHRRGVPKIRTTTMQAVLRDIASPLAVIRRIRELLFQVFLTMGWKCSSCAKLQAHFIIAKCGRRQPPASAVSAPEASTGQHKGWRYERRRLRGIPSVAGDYILHHRASPERFDDNRHTRVRSKSNQISKQAMIMIRARWRLSPRHDPRDGHCLTHEHLLYRRREHRHQTSFRFTEKAMYPNGFCVLACRCGCSEGRPAALPSGASRQNNITSQEGPPPSASMVIVSTIVNRWVRSSNITSADCIVVLDSVSANRFQLFGRHRLWNRPAILVRRSVSG